MKIKEYLENKIVLLDGAMGTLLQKQGLQPGEPTETWNLKHPEKVKEVHRSYFDAGSNVVLSNTFGANTLHFEAKEAEEIIARGLENAFRAREESSAPQEKFVAFDIGPLGQLLKPLGKLGFEEAVAIFAGMVKAAEKHGPDLFFIETMSDSYETKAALLAVKENSSLPVFVSNAYSENGKLMTGADARVMLAITEGMGADAVGVNCSFGPDKLAPVVEEYLRHSSVPVLVKPNAGMPRDENGETVYDTGPGEFAKKVAELVKKGARIAGGCCGTTPEYIKALKEALKGMEPVHVSPVNETVVSSYSKLVEISADPVIVGERINPTGKKRFQQALVEHDMDHVYKEALKQEEAGAHVLDVNVGLPQIDEVALLGETVAGLQAITSLPLQIDTTSAEAMEKALRLYNGKPLINSVNGTEESMSAILPLVKKYGGVVVALTLDEGGIPKTAEGRFKIAEKIILRAKDFGVEKKDIIFDTLTMAVSADKDSAGATLESMRMIKERLGCHTILGVSNISFGLPERGIINGAFFTMALENGLSAAIMNPLSPEMMKSYHSFRAIRGMDDDFSAYIGFAAGQAPDAEPKPMAKAADDTESDGLGHAIKKGLKEKAGSITKELLASKTGLDIVTEEIVPALDEVGLAYETGKAYLPQLLMSAEAAKSAFEEIKAAMKTNEGAADKCTIVIATVEGDIHDIGKNIVKLLLENYGFRVVDLGKDVPPDTVVQAVLKEKAPIAGLSALMTTTVPAMEKTISLIHERASECRVVVGGAVLNEEYAEKIGADKYCKDAMATVRYAEEVYKEING